jgi:protease I
MYCGMPVTGADRQPEPVIKDKNLVTAQAWPNHPAWLRAYIELLGAKINI